jgi:long-chain acyl-CoA synthetase
MKLTMTNKSRPLANKADISDLKRIFDIPRYQLEQYPQEKALTGIKGEEFISYSSRELVDNINRLSAGLRNAGFEKGEKISIIAENRPEWHFADLGMLQAGIINVPVFPKFSEHEYKYIFNNAGVRAVFVSNQELWEQVQAIRKEVPSLQRVFTFDKIEGADHWTTLLDNVRKEDLAEVEDIRSTIGEEDLATIVYTSGTTGKPKGVMLSHRNIISNLKACLPIMPVDERHRALSFLPLNHVFERMTDYLYMTRGLSIYYAESIDTVARDLRMVRPHVFTTVPRLLEKVYEKIVAKGSELGIAGRLIFHWSLELAKRYDLRGKSLWYQLQQWMADKLVFGKWRAALGGEVIALVSGGAALNPKLARIFTAAGVPVLEGYGLTETSPVLSINRIELDDRRFGSVGKVIDNVEVWIADDGEILCKGPNVMMGYYNMPEKTEQTIDRDGWLHTGDLGEFDEENFLYITDRKKSVFKTSGGKYVAPQRIENTFTESLFIENIMAVGEGRKMVTAIIEPDFEHLREWCRKNEIEWTSREEIIGKEEIRRKYEKIAEERNRELNHTEQIKKFRLVPEKWSVESGELTPTMKLKRGVLYKKYEALIEEMYEVEAYG